MKFILYLVFLTSLTFSNLNSQIGKRWEEIARFPETQTLRNFDSDNGNHVVLCIDGLKNRVYLSNDLENWTEKFIFSMNYRSEQTKEYYSTRVRKLQIINQSIYIAVDLNRQEGYTDEGHPINHYCYVLFKSNDLGETWETVPLIEKERSGSSGFFSMSDEKTGIFVYQADNIVTEERILTTKNGWDNFEVRDASKVRKNGNPELVCRYADIVDENILLQTIHNEIFHSSDFGATWNEYKVSEEFNIGSGGEKLQRGGSNYYFSNSYRIAKSNDFGKTWELFEDKKALVNIVSFDNDNFTALLTDGLYKTEDGGKTFEIEIPLFQNRTVNLFDMNYISRSKRCAVTGGITYKNDEIITNKGGLVAETEGKVLIPTLITSPDNRSPLSPNFTLTWTENSLATQYDILVKEFEGIESTDTLPNYDWGDNNLFYEDYGRTVNQITFNNQKLSSLYIIRIRCKNDTLASEWNEFNYFTSKTVSGVADFNFNNENVFIEGNKIISEDEIIEKIKVYDLYGREIKIIDRINSNIFYLNQLKGAVILQVTTKTNEIYLKYLNI